MDDISSSLSDMQINLGEFPSAKIKVDEYFKEWLSLDSTVDFVEIAVSEVSSASGEQGQASRGGGENSAQSSHQPPRSPSKKSPKKRGFHESVSTVESLGGAIVIASKGQLSAAAVSTVAAPEAKCSGTLHTLASFDNIPVFYKPGMIPRRKQPVLAVDSLSNHLEEIEAQFRPYPSGMPIEKFVTVTKRLCGLPSFFNRPLCVRLASFYAEDGTSRGALNTNARVNDRDIRVKLKSFLRYWREEIEPFTPVERFFRIIKQPTAEYISTEDFTPFIQELLHFHPGLEFLDGQEEFQKKYALTVVTRIFYKTNTSRTGKISLSEVKKSNLLTEFMHVDEEIDINKVHEYFSYEHFYVLYCRFFELDTDKDLKLTREDLLKFGNHCLSEAIVDRIFQVAPRAFSDVARQSGNARNSATISYPDFIYFFLSEEDKTSDAGLRYWFNCLDFDGDGVVSPEDMKYFYRAQLHRITSLGQESVNFADVLCQMMDMIAPQNDQALQLCDFTRPTKKAVSGVLFDILFNLNKFVRFESRDPFQEKAKRDDAFDCDWDRFANFEYHRLAAEEEGFGEEPVRMEAVSMGSSGVDMNASNSFDSDWAIDSDDDDLAGFATEFQRFDPIETDRGTGVIKKVCGHDMYDIDYESGGQEFNVPVVRIRRRQKSIQVGGGGRVSSGSSRK